MKTITIKPNELKAIALFAPTADIRYYLNGILVHANANVTRLVATNGHWLAMFETPAENDGVELEEIIVPIHVVAQVVKSMTRGSYGDVTLTIDDGKYAFNYSGVAVSFAPVEGKFPEYRRVVPESVSGEPAQFNPEYIVAIGKAQKIFNTKLSPLIWHNGESGALFELIGADNFIGVLMPVRVEAGRSAPGVYWARQVLTAVEPIRASEAGADALADELL